MTTLGGAIAPINNGSQALERAVEQYLAERGDAAATLNKILLANQAILDQLVAATAALSASAKDLAGCASELTRVVVQPAPQVTVNIPEAPEAPEQEAPVVNVTVPEPVVNVTVQESPEPPEKGCRKRVVRDAQGLITEIIEEPL